MKVALTGANGFLGSHIARVLSRSGSSVRALVRSGASTVYLRRLRGLEVVELPDTSEASLRPAIGDAEALVHNAALAADWGDLKDFRAANVGFTASVLSAAVAQGVRQVVHISSNAVLGEEDCRAPKGASAPLNPKLPYLLEGLLPSAMNHYRTTKAEGERLAVDFAKEKGLDLTVLRPVWIFGPRELHSGPYEYCQTVASGTPFFPGSNENLFHTVYVGDVARAVSRALERHLSGVHVFNIGPRQAPLMREYFGWYCEALGRRRPRNVPQWLLWPAAFLMEAAWSLAHSRKPPLLTRARLYMFYANNVYDVSDAERELGFVADTDLRRAVRKTVRWWRMNRLL